MTSTSSAATRGMPFDDGYRALEVFDRVPAGHTGVLVSSEDWHPHLKFGEFAVVDTSDKSLEFGELYVITLSEGKPHMSLAIVQLLRERPCGRDNELLGLWYAFHLAENRGFEFRGRNLRYVDGPINTTYWPTKCVGRVVGVIAPGWKQGWSKP